MARRNKTAWAALLLTAILFFFPARVLAAEKPDPGRNLSLSMTLKTPGENGRTAAGAEVTAYLIAKATFTSRGIDYVLDDDFAETRLDLDDNITQSMVDDLVKYAGNNNITGISERLKAFRKDLHLLFLSFISFRTMITIHWSGYMTALPSPRSNICRLLMSLLKKSGTITARTGLTM